MVKGALCFSLFIFLADGIIYDCTYNKTIYLNKNEVAFFRTTNYPTLLPLNEFRKCNLTFVLSENYPNHRLQSVITKNRYSIDWGEGLGTFIDSTNDTFFSFNANYDDDSWLYLSLTGYIFFDEWNSDCPFEAINKNKPFLITDEIKIIYFYSLYDGIANYYSMKCRWQFKAPSDYGFKLVIFDFSLNSTFTIKNTTDIIVNHKSVKKSHPYYNSDNYLYIDLFQSSHVPLSGYVAIVKKFFSEVNDTCISYKNDSTITWTNIKNNFEAYNSNARCEFNLLIFPKTQIVVKATPFMVEENVDILRYQIDEYNTVTIGEEVLFILFPYYNGSIKHILWEFVSDGSIESSGFKVTFSTIECICASSIISCNSTFNIMKDTDNYCSNLHCIFTILSCPSDLILLKIGDLFEGIIKVISNDQIVFLMDTVEALQPINSIYLNSNNTNTIEIFTYPVIMLRTISFTVLPYEAPKVDFTLTLSNSSSPYLIDSSSFTLGNFQISKELKNQNFIITLYASGTVGSNTWIFNNISLTTPLEGAECFSGDSTICTIKNNEFAILNKLISHNSFKIFAVQLSGQQKGCVFKKTIFQTYVNYALNNITIPAMSNEMEGCEVTILLDIPVIITNLWTTSKIANTKIFVGTNKQKIYLEFNSKPANQWKDITLYPNVYTVYVPKSATLFIRLEKLWYNEFDRFYSPTFYPSNSYQTIISTPNYINTKINGYGLPTHNFVTYNTSNNYVKFTALDFMMLPGDLFHFIVDGQLYYMKEIGESLIFRSPNITLFYSYQTQNYLNSGALIYVESIF